MNQTNTENLFSQRSFHGIYKKQSYLLNINKTIQDIDLNDVSSIYTGLSELVKEETSLELGIKKDELDDFAKDLSDTYSNIFNEKSYVKNYPAFLSQGKKKNIKDIEKEFMNSVQDEASFISYLKEVGGIGGISKLKKVASIAEKVRTKGSGGYSKAFGSFIESLTLYGLNESASNELSNQLNIMFRKAIPQGKKTENSVVKKGDVSTSITFNESNRTISFSASIKATSSSTSNSFSAVGGLKLDRFRQQSSLYDSLIVALIWHRGLIREVEKRNNKKPTKEQYIEAGTNIYGSFAAALIADYVFLGEDRPLVMFTFRPKESSNEGVFDLKFMYEYFQKVAKEKKFPTIYSKKLKDEISKAENKDKGINDLYILAKDLSISVSVTAKFI